MAKRAGDLPGCAGRIPWLHPWAHALFKIGESFDDALAAPYQYVSWVFANTENENDRVWKAIQADPDFDARFFPVFQSGPFTVWQSAKTIGPIS